MMSEKEEGKQFRKHLFEFWSSKGVVNLKIPQIGGRELDLYHLYKAVCKRGGAEIVSNNKLWKEIVNEFGLPVSCTSASFTLRNHYTKYLLAYEQKYFFGRDEHNSVKELAGARNRKHVKTEDRPYINSASLLRKEANHDYNSYNAQQFLENKSQSSIKTILNEKFNKIDKNEDILYIKKTKMMPIVSEIKRIMLAFESQISSEMNFALNTLLLYSCNYSYPFLLEQYTNLLDQISTYLEKIMKNSPSLKSIFLNMSLEEKTSKEGNPMIEPINSLLSGPLKQFSKLKHNKIAINYELFDEVNLLEQCRTIFHILRNMSFVKGNEIAIFKNDRLFCLILHTFLYTNDSFLANSTLDLISNMALHINLKNFNFNDIFCSKILEFLDSENHLEIEAALDALNNLILYQENESYLESILNKQLETLTKLLISSYEEIRIGVLKLLCFLSDLKMSTRVLIAKENKCLMRLVGLLCAGLSKNGEKIAKLAAVVISNIAMAPAARIELAIYERDLFLVAATDATVSKVICNVLGDLDNVTLEPPKLN